MAKTPFGNWEPIPKEWNGWLALKPWSLFWRMVERKRVEGVGPLPARLPVAHNFVRADQ